MDLVYLDFAKAFDSVNHRFLLAKLKSSGIDGAVLNWIKSYLSNRSYQVQIDGVLSEEAPCLRGVPQGSVIGPLLFLLYINDLPAALGDYAFLFVDDFLPPSSSLSSTWAWAGKWDLQSTPTNVHASTSGTSLHFPVFLRGRQRPPNSPGHQRPRPWGSPRPSPHQPTAERLRIQQGVCCSSSEDPSVNYTKQRLPRSTAP